MGFKTIVLTIFYRTFRSKRFPSRLCVANRPTLLPKDFSISDRLYIAFRREKTNTANRLVPPWRNIPSLQTIRFPDSSCNWSRFSRPSDVWFRENGASGDGCFAIRVEHARFESKATVAHDPLQSPVENYSHSEIRELQEGESIYAVPPKNRKVMNRTERQKYRAHLREHMDILIYPV